ncbi:MAG: prolipoprotein diacylglyceryl transferase family protein [bacterium]
MMFHLYGLVVGIAVVVWWSLAERLEPRAKTIIPWVLLSALVGARAYHVVDYWEYYGQNLGQVVAIWNGGLGIFGGIIGGMLGLWIYFKGRTLKVMGTVVIPLPLAQAIGRVGNGVNGEFTNLVAGVPWWGAEAILDLGLFCLIWQIRPIWRIWVYLMGYALIRLVLQPYRR